jgi:predicted MFS family arabinose efflux permease
MRLTRDLALICVAAFLRALGVGLTGMVLGIYLARSGISAAGIGLVIAAGLAGVVVATLLVGLRADQLGRRQTLRVLALLGTAGGVGMALTSRLPAVLWFAFAGMLNGMGRDRGPAAALEQVLIPESVAAGRRTWSLAGYNVLMDAGHALGALAGALPFLFRSRLGIGLFASYRLTFAFYASLSLLGYLLYLFLTPQIEAAHGRPASAKPRTPISPESKRIITRLAALFGVDGLGGGFLTGALLAYWFFRRFGVAEEALGLLFFTARLLNSGSSFLAAWLARRIGLLNTMVFTHIPSSLFLMAVPLAASFPLAACLFLARECLVQMDVPARQAYLVAVLPAEDRVLASGASQLARNLCWAATSSLAGYFMQALGLAAPLFFGGGIKIGYDLMLYGAFRRLKPADVESVERSAVTAGS